MRVFGISFGRRKNMDKKKKLKFYILFTFIFGIAWVCASIFVNIYTSNFIKNGVKTDAVIVSIEVEEDFDEKDFHVLVEYDVNGKKYQSYLNAYSSKMEAGLTIPIWYKVSNPKKIIYANNEFFMFWLFLCGGCIVLIISYILFINYKKIKNSKIKVQQQEVIEY